VTTNRVRHLGTVGLGIPALLASGSGDASGPATEARPAADSAPSSRIAFISYPRSGRSPNNRLYVTNADGSGQRVLTRKAWQELSWSPDGRKIAFVSARDGGEIYVVNADGTGERRLTHNRELDHAPAWPPDGQKIAFGGGLRGGAGSEIYIMNAYGSGQRDATRELLRG
jgi:Tol biopolymer transport system component